jgi:hypothetical protein
MRHLVVAGLLLAILALPALLAGAHLDAPAGAEEVQRVSSALRGGGGPSASDVARQFFLATISPAPAAMPTQPEAIALLMARARLVQVMFLFALSGGVYFAVLLARGRVQALLACLFLPMLPPVASEGQILRPETVSTLFGVLALLLLQSLAQTIPRRSSKRVFVHNAVLVGYCVVSAVALAMALAALPARGVGLFVPGLVMSAAALQIGARMLPIVRRKGIWSLPMRSINRRLWPWTIVSLAGPAIGLLLLVHTLHVPVDRLPASHSEVGLFPVAWWFRVPFFALLCLGAVAAVARIGLRFGRRGRVGADFVLLAYGAIHLTGAIGVADLDLLPAVPAMAIVLSEGVYAAIHGIGWWRLRRRRSPLTSASR